MPAPTHPAPPKPAARAARAPAARKAPATATAATPAAAPASKPTPQPAPRPDPGPDQPAPSVHPMGDSALILRFGTEVDPATTARVQALAQALAAQPLPGQRDLVPAYTTLTLHYRPEQVPSAAEDDLRPAFERLCDLLAARLAQVHGRAAAPPREVAVPVWYGGAAGPDLDDVARQCGLSADEVVARHLASPHQVCMLGFAPGFPFITGLDAALRMPRRGTPRTAVPPGSVGIAREQTCIYPLATPGGWNLIGRTPLRLFNPEASPPSWLRPGDRLRFEPIDEARYQALLAEQFPQGGRA